MNPHGAAGGAEKITHGPTVTPDAIREIVLERLVRFETLFRDSLASPVKIVDEIGSYVAAPGGKRVRPTLHLLCTSLCGYRGPHDVLMAAVLEMIHSATLVHDDIIDEATTRRGRPSANHEWGNSVTVLFGDFMLAKAMEMALRAGSLGIMKGLADATLRMTEGEMLQTRFVGRSDLTVDEHLDMVERKTAALFSCCCESAGLLADVDDAAMGALSGYGRDLGMAFQLVDDLLDLTGDEKTLGKPAASDLREGKVTLAVLDLLERGTVADRDLVHLIMEAGEPGMPEIDRLRARLEDAGALERARARALGYAQRAAAGLARFPDSPARRALEGLPDLLVFRER